MKYKLLIAFALASLASFSGCKTKSSEDSLSPTYEYRAMSLAEMFKADPNAKEKIGEMIVLTDSSFNRTDMDASDYTEALNRLASSGWELVSVNKSNYWIFRKQKK
ncbi:MAG: hypothetical protein ACSHX0_13125 [Akkermansiaceae bacterium]